MQVYTFVSRHSHLGESCNCISPEDEIASFFSPGSFKGMTTGWHPNGCPACGPTCYSYLSVDSLLAASYLRLDYYTTLSDDKGRVSLVYPILDREIFYIPYSNGLSISFQMDIELHSYGYAAVRLYVRQAQIKYPIV
ncbi:predicted protein [Histoplasma capsulatum G186AR]|uniref:Uncharacterized protein n=1 Tax=Ajellomyces capsulatus (strain G186AR / H82 / ATCC MYA-2454 / RMSCC 2432) TaxID=447093 RepID=C0NMX4_AJECG|nr:uncharacterized protein HCBG_04101 [Histoplasma capsulatum G186AR]EEH07222.1 predicted protein [Histoplasma capsulatum G186AR]